MKRILMLMAAVATFLAFQGQDARAQTKPAGEHDAAIKTLSEYVGGPAASQTDTLLRNAGFDQAMMSEIAGWDSFSAVRKIELYVQAAAHHTPGSEQAALAALSQALAREYSTIAEEPNLRAYHDLKISPDGFRLPASTAARPITDPDTQKAILTLSEYSSSTGELSPQRLLRAAGVGDDEIYKLMRSHSSVEAVLSTAIASRADQRAAISAMVKETTSVYSTAPHEKSFKPFLKKAPGPEMALALMPPPDVTLPDPPPGGSGGPRGGGGGSSSPDVGGGTNDKPHGPGGADHPDLGTDLGGSAGLAGGNGPRPHSPGSGGGAAETFNRSQFGLHGPGASSPGRSNLAGSRFTRLVDQRRGMGLGMSFASQTRGSMRIRLGGVVFGNTVTGKGQPRSLVLDSAVTVKARDGKIYVLPDANPQLACLAVQMVTSEKRFGYGAAGITDHVKDKFHVLLHPALVNTRMGKDLVIADTLPSTIPESIQHAPATSELARARIRSLFESLRTERFGTWQLVDVETEIELHEGLVLARPSRSPLDRREAGVFVELRPIDKAGGFSEPFASRFRQEFASIAALYPPYAEANEMARVLAVVRWVKASGGSLPAKCQRPPEEPTPAAISVSPSGVEWREPYDVVEEQCSSAPARLAQGCKHLMSCIRRAEGQMQTQSSSRSSESLVLDTINRCISERIAKACRSSYDPFGCAHTAGEEVRAYSERAFR